MRHYRFFSFFLLIHFFSQVTAQQPDTLLSEKNNGTFKQVIPDDSLLIDSTKHLRGGLMVVDSTAVAMQDSMVQAAMKKTADSLNTIRIGAAARDILKSTRKNYNGKELLFYSLIFMLIFYALLRLLFPKYFTDLTRVYFRTTLKQTQVREQLLQTPLPSLLLNGFFIVSGGMYSAFILQHFNVAPKFSFWQLWLYSGILLSIIYMMKFAGVFLAGWLFNRSDAASAYTFIVFMNNKITGIILLPFLILLAFGTPQIYPATLLVSITIIACLFLYRFYLSVGVMRGQARVGLLHFLLYLCAFEVLPLLILFKWVMLFLK